MIWIIGVVVTILLIIYFIMINRVKFYTIANSTILGAITYESMNDSEKQNADELVAALLEHNPSLQEDLSSIWKDGRKGIRWRWYSMAFALNNISPNHADNLGWTPSNNVYNDVIMVGRKIPDFYEHLESRTLYEKYLKYMKI